MKKIGILTYHRAINYGALLQGYALQEKIKECGADAGMIDYRSDFIENAYRTMWGLNKKKLSSWKYTIKGIHDVKTKKKKFRAFGEKYLNLTKKYDRSNVSATENEFDKIVTGSDQVWNMDVCGNDRAYMLDYVKDDRKKASYAVSLGSYKFKDDEVGLIKKFNNISIREKGSCEYVSDITGKEGHVDVDPTLLLTGDKWEKVVLKENPVKKPYIFIYSVHPQNNMVEYAKKLAKEKNLEIYHLHNRVKKEMKEPGVNLLFDCSPEEFLTLIHDAEYVITNSFHGTVFSIVYHRQFLSELETRGGFNNRVWELLNALGINRRILEQKIYFDRNFNIDEAIDWDDVEQKLAGLREGSVEYIRKLISE